MSTLVCTRASQFASVPAYHAQVVGERVCPPWALVGSEFIAAAGREEFRLVVTFAGAAALLAAHGFGGDVRRFCDEVLTRRLNWSVSWFGILS